MEKFLQVGVITSTHGVHGEVKVFPTTDDVKRFRDLKEVLLDRNGEKISLKIGGVKFFKQFAILKFEGYDSLDEIEKYKGSALFVSRENAVPLDQDEYFIADLIGMKVTDESGNDIGSVKDVMRTGSNDVYVIGRKDGRELLLPAIRDCVLDIDVDNGLMKVHILEGLE